MSNFKSNETNSKSDCSTAKTESLLQLIPPYIQGLCKKPIDAELRVSFDAPTQQATITYSITWESDAEQDDDTKTAISNSSTSLSNFTGIVAPVDAKCDGPCHREFKSNLLNSIGRCGHNLCHACFGIVTNKDGTAGCSSIDCNWKGGSREDTKKFFEKEICRKQRDRARDMQSRGIDVKIASAASSMTTVTSVRPRTSETTCSVATPHPPTVIQQKTLLVMLEASIHGSMEYRFSSKTLPSTYKVLKSLTKLIKKKDLNALERLACGTLYYAQERPDQERELHLMERRDLNHLCLYHFPKVEDEVVFVLDFNNFVQNGREVYFG